MKRLFAAMTAALLMVSLVSGAAFASSNTPTKQTGQSAPLLIPAVQVFPGTPISGGNDATVATSNLDTYASFVIVDTNVRISANGFLTSWSFYAGAALPVTLDIVRLEGSAYVVIGESAPVTPTALQVGTVVTSTLPFIPVLAGDYVGMYFASTGAVPFNYVGAPAVWTPQGLAANPSVGATLPIEVGTSNRTYSISVAGTTSAYDNSCQVLTATGKVNWIQPKGNVDINLGVSTAGLAPLSQYTAYLDEGGWPVIGTFTTDAYGNGSLGYSVPGGTLSRGTHTWRVYINGPAGSACAGYTVLVSAPIIFTVPGV